jgi:hypothetical protein
VLLDEPYPANLPVVPSCHDCNEGASADEEYVACLIDCVLAGSASPEEVQRSKIRRILSEKPALAARLTKAKRQMDGNASFSVEDRRVRNVALKLARGHALYELNEPQFNEPFGLGYVPLPLLLEDNRNNFERPPISHIWPEVGSRGMQRLFANGSLSPEWIIVQMGRYRYLASVGDAVVVRIVLSEYLACEVVWS